MEAWVVTLVIWCVFGLIVPIHKTSYYGQSTSVAESR
jgi:hypothetical protein